MLAATAIAIDLPELPSLIGLHGAIVAPDATTFDIIIAIAVVAAN